MRSDILHIIHRGEGKTCEFKVTLPTKGQLAQSAIAFANTAGGKIIIGIQDKTGKIIGISEEDALHFPDRITDAIYDSCYPAILPEIYIERIDEKMVLVTEIYPGSLKPYYLRRKGYERGVYIRVGATNKPADAEMIRELERQRQNLGFDEQMLSGYSETMLDVERLQRDFRRLTGRELAYQHILNLKILNQEQGRTSPTVGGVLLAGTAHEFEYARIKCARFKGVEMDEFIDQKEFSGPLYDQVEQAMKFAQVYIAKTGKIEGLQRIDRYEVPLEAIREALVNAVVHRDYSISGSDIKFAIFDDRIEITSPGALPRSLEIEDILAGRSEIRNKTIARFFKEIGFIEQWGTGIRKMMTSCTRAGLHSPEMRESGLFFQVIFHKGAAEHQDNRAVKEPHTEMYISATTRKLPENYPEITRKILTIIRNSPQLTRKELARQVHLSENGVKYHLKNLKKQGIIERIGSARSGYWRILDRE